MQFAWLDLFGGKWILLDGNFKYPARSWPDENLALAQLREEGWTIAGPYRNRHSIRLATNDPGRKYRGYAMKRTVH